MKLLRSYLLLTAIFTSTPYVFCWQGNTPEGALEEMVTAEKIELLAKHLPVKVEQAINSLDDKRKKELAAKLLPQSLMKRDGVTFAKSDDGTHWEIKNPKREVEATVRVVNSFVSGSDALVHLEFTEYHPSENSKHSDSDENPSPPHSSEPRMLLVSMQLDGGEWRIVGFGPWEKKSLEDEDFLRGIVPNSQEANAAAAVSTLRVLNTSLVVYSTTYPEVGFPAHLEQLARGNLNDATSEHAALVDRSFAENPVIRDGYEFHYTMIDPGAAHKEGETAAEGRYRITATPVEFGKTGSKSFFTDQSCVIRSTNESREANENDEPM
jgi:type IV pilus assembly protein PilA